MPLTRAQWLLHQHGARECVVAALRWRFFTGGEDGTGGGGGGYGGGGGAPRQGHGGPRRGLHGGGCGAFGTLPDAATHVTFGGGEEVVYMRHRGWSVRVGWMTEEIRPCPLCNEAREVVLGTVLVTGALGSWFARRQGGMLFGRGAPRIFIKRGWRFVKRVVRAAAAAISRPGTAVARRERARWECVKCKREREQVRLVEMMIALGAEPAMGRRDPNAVRFAAGRSHLHLLTLFIDAEVGCGMRRRRRRAAEGDEVASIVSSQPGEQGAEEEDEDSDDDESGANATPRWLMDGQLLFEAVRRRNIRLVELLSQRGAAKPENCGTRAYEYAASLYLVEELGIMRDHGATTRESCLIVVMKRALMMRMVSFESCLCATGRKGVDGGRVVEVLDILVRGLPGTRADFANIAHDYLTASLTELGSVRLMKLAVDRGADIEMGEGSALFFAILMGNHRLAAYLAKELRVRVRPMVKFRRVAAIVFMLAMNAGIVSWFLANLGITGTAAWCWFTYRTSPDATTVAISGWCSQQTGYDVLDADYWSRTAIVILILFITVIMAHRAMPLHGVLLGSLAVVTRFYNDWKARKLARLTPV
ncbi:hypothetical protein HK101_005048 [Irineochytrium annulatum]|nr:hypothetical protein HK101_005048 [Irineochytrium annulatum]